MLVLTRHENEDIVIGEGANRVIVKLIAIRGESVRIGIEAPRKISVHRQEVYDVIKERE